MLDRMVSISTRQTLTHTFSYTYIHGVTDTETTPSESGRARRAGFR